jgi:cellulose biosynthesis protein BcsQ
VDKRENLTEIATEIINEVFGDHLLKTYIPVDASIKKAQWEQLPILDYNASTKAGKVSLDLAREVLSIVK